MTGKPYETGGVSPLHFMETDAATAQQTDLRGTVSATSVSEHALNEQILADQRDKMQWHPLRRVKAVGQEVVALVQDITRP